MSLCKDPAGSGDGKRIRDELLVFSLGRGTVWTFSELTEEVSETEGGLE